MINRFLPRVSLIFLIIFFSVPGFAGSQGMAGGSCLFRACQKEISPLKPKTRYEILQAHGWLVDLSDGVTSREAKLIAQRELVLKEEYIYEQYRYQNPKVVRETEEEYQVRIPVKFSLSAPDNNYNYLICINKNDGKITCVKDER